VHHAVEWQCSVLLESDMANAYLHGDNSGMTATDTIKNTARAGAGTDVALLVVSPTWRCGLTLAPAVCAQVYHVAKLQTKRCSADAFAVALAEHFVATHPKARTRSGVTLDPRAKARAPADSASHMRAPPSRRCPPRR
jgi:urate oxidase